MYSKLVNLKAGFGYKLPVGGGFKCKFTGGGRCDSIFFYFYIIIVNHLITLFSISKSTLLNKPNINSNIIFITMVV